MDDLTILVPSQIAADGLLQRYHNLFHMGENEGKAKEKSKPIISRRIC